MPYTVTPFVFNDYWENVQNELGTTIMDVLFYGIFLVLFFVAMHLLYHRITSPGRKPLLVLTTAMALLATTQFSLHIASTSLALRLLHRAIVDGQDYVPDPPGNGLEHVYWSLVMTQDLVLVTNTVFTDGLLTYRCYLVWGRPPKIFLVVPMLLILATLATGYVTSYDQDYYSGPAHFDARIVFTLSLFTNFALMILTEFIDEDIPSRPNSPLPFGDCVLRHIADTNDTYARSPIELTPPSASFATTSNFYRPEGQRGVSSGSNHYQVTPPSASSASASNHYRPEGQPGVSSGSNHYQGKHIRCAFYTDDAKITV
ncbi:hypothetical protein R3P38DRAFT_3475351 [Favolaschia claudopus]|uniref:Uncharacterized protein n=1 Tax=Favolaschia claudopus TaxID=2862362 RepID=A0AAW0CFW0_9AGAR